MLIALSGLHEPSWERRATAGSSRIPVQGQPEGSRRRIGALHPVELMWRKQKMIPRAEIDDPIGVLQRNTGAAPQHKHPFV